MPLSSYASRFTSFDSDGRDAHPNGPDEPSLCTLVTLNDMPSVEFDVQIDAITTAAPFIKLLFETYPNRRKFGISATADQIQVLLKYMNTGIYDPTDVSHRFPDKFAVVFGQIKFYLFSQRMGSESLSDLVRVGIQAGLDVMSWSPIPKLDDTVLFPPEGGEGMDGSLLITLFGYGENYYPKLHQDDPVRRSLLRYCVHLWRNYGRFYKQDSVDQFMSDTNPELWRDMKEFKTKVPTDVYEYEAPKYGKDSDYSSWISRLLGKWW